MSKVEVGKVVNTRGLRGEIKVYPLIDELDAFNEFEYLLIKDLNDTVESAKQLAAYLKDIKCNINMIPYNPTEKNDYQRPSNNVYGNSNQEKL